MHEREVSLERQDEVLAAAIRCYRLSPDPRWAAVLLEMLSPMLVAAGSRFAFIPDAISREDVDHQLIVEALHVARTFALPRSSRYVQRWLERRLLRRMARWLTGAARSQNESLEADQEAIGLRDTIEPVSIELADCGVPPEDLALLYRSHVLRMTTRELAADLGIPIAVVRNRQRRALRRLRTWSATKFHRPPGGVPAAA